MKKQIIIFAISAAFSQIGLAKGLYFFGDYERTSVPDSPSRYTLTKNDNGYDFGIGYQINKIFSAELAYRDLYRVDNRMRIMVSYDYRGSLELSGVQASVLGAYPINQQCNFYGRLGAMQVDSKYFMQRISYGISKIVDEGKATDTELLAGLGVAYSFSDSWKLRLEYDRFSKIRDSNLSTLGVGVAYHF